MTSLAVSACTSRPVVTNDLPQCERCHGGGGSAAPPRSAHGATATSDPGVGAHRSHLEGSALRLPVACDTCHDVPTSVDAHVDGVARVRFEDASAAGGAAATWNASAGRCENAYCHGATLRASSQGSAVEPLWTLVDGSQKACGSCHGFPPASPHPAAAADARTCARCHGQTVRPDGTIDVAAGKHMDGIGQAPDASRCDGCHAAPPATGAHLAHANWPDPTALSYGSLAIAVGTSPAGAPAYLFGCGYCHPVSAARHQDGVDDVAVAPEGSGLKLQNAPNAAFDAGTASCSGVYCHGATLRAGSQGAAVSPVWTRVDGTQRTCASCHAAPPASHAVYQNPTQCQSCHSDTLNADGSIAFGSKKHIDGSTPVPTACNACHAAPPGSGAHRSHANPADVASVSYGSLRIDVGTSPAGQPAYVFGCGYCHPVSSARHQDGAIDVAVAPEGSGLKLLNAANAAFDPGSASCGGVYCHGATLAAGTQGSATAPVWTAASGTQNTCASCHAEPPASHVYPASWTCSRCHPQTANADGSIAVSRRTHVNGSVEAPSVTDCNGCHRAPPGSGAHRVHANPPDPSAVAYGGLSVLEDVAPGGAASYDFGCGHCHPADPARHRDATVQVDLAPPATPDAHEMKARNEAGAAFDPASGACSGVYCHSSGQFALADAAADPPLLPTFARTPPWTSAPGALGCSGCHGNPPRYPSGGAGLATANSHLVLADDGWESGHFQGLPGYWHTSKHGGNWSADNDAAPITCQTCHFESVDPAASGPSGFYYLDTTGEYQLPGGDPSRIGTWYDRLQCTACHDGTLAAQGAGRAQPLRHVNGSRDVAFDARTALPAISWLPASPNTPTRPYWVTNGQPGITFPDPAIPDAVEEGTTLSLHLGSAGYDGSTKTCTNVACHLAQTQVTWGAPHGFGACGHCHPFIR